jgi:hypothetical protein
MKKNAIGLILAASLLGHAAPSLADAPDLPLANYTGIPQLGARLAPLVPNALMEQLKAQGLALFADAAAFDQLHLCYARVGVTELTGPGLNVRAPALTMFVVNTRDAASWDPLECKVNALESATAGLAKGSIKELFADVDLARSEGGQLRDEKADAGMVQLNQSGVSGRTDALFAMLHEKKMGALFDYRTVQTSIVTDVAEFNDGRVACVAQVGLTGRSNDGRNARIPGYVVRQVIMNYGDPLECKAEAARTALRGFLALPLEKMLTDFSLARESGRAQPVLAKVIATAKRLEKQLAAPKKPAAGTARK